MTSGRQRRRRAGPAVGQEVDEDPLAGGHGVDGHPARQRQPDRRAVGIAPRRADIVGHRVRQFVDRNVHRTLEADHDDRAGGDDFGFDVLGELEHQPRVAAGRRERRLALDRVIGPAGEQPASGRRGPAGRKRRRPAQGNAGPSAPMRGPATKFQRQPFAPFQRCLLASTIRVAGEAPSPTAH